MIISIIGWTGTLLCLTAFFLVSRGRIEGTGYLFHLMNAFGAIGIGIPVFMNGTWSVVALEVAWFTIAVLAMNKRRKDKKTVKA